MFATAVATAAGSAPDASYAAPQAALLRAAHSRPSSDSCHAIGSPTDPPRRCSDNPRTPPSQPTPDGARSELVPHLVGHDRDVLELDVVDPRRRPARRTSTSETSAGRRAAVLPGHLEPARSLAVDDLAAGVALQLIPAAEAVVAADREEPAADPLGRGQRVPDVLDRRVVGATDRTARPSPSPSGPCRPSGGWPRSRGRCRSCDGSLLRCV